MNIKTALMGIALSVAALPTALPAAHGQDYPSKALRLIVPFGAGGSTDVIARVFAAKLSEVMNQTIVVENRAGAGGIIGTEAAAKSTPDGYTLFVFGINQAITSALYKKLPYHHQRDFIPVSLYGTMPNILVINPGLPPKNVSEFVAYAKANPGKMKYVSSGIGASPHLTMELFKMKTGTDLVHVPYKNMAQGYTDLIGGQLQAMFGNLPQQIPNTKAGRVRALGVTSARRADQLPEVPTIIESGIPDFEVTVWQGVAVPAGTSKAVIAKVHGYVMKALAVPDLKQRFFEQGVLAAPSTREEFAAFIQSETVRWTKVVKDSGAAVE